MEEKEATLNKRLIKKEKKHKKIRSKLIERKDIKYVGPLSYRYLRALAWIALAMSQLVLIYNFSNNVLGWSPAGETGTYILSIFGGLSTPFFIIASFGLILSGKRGYRSFLIMYGFAFVGLGLAVIIAYYRYVDRIFGALSLSTEEVPIVFQFISEKSEINVFSDLFMFSLFHTFLNYKPKKIFINKNLIWFRLFTIFPVLYVIFSYIFKTLGALNVISMPFFVYPFLTTKSPLVLLVFVLASFLIKYREALFEMIGATKEEYEQYLTTRRNSLAFSVQLSLLILAVAIFEFIIIIVVGVHLMSHGMGADEAIGILPTYGLGQAGNMIIAIPFILLYSYTKTHKNDKIDLFLPLIGIGVIVLVYIESISGILLHFLGK